MLLETVAAIAEFNTDSLRHRSWSYSQHLIIYVRTGTFSEIAMIEQKKPFIYYEYFIIEEDASLRLLTFISYSPQKCNVLQLVEVNRFDKSLLQWQHSTFSIEKFSNLHGCKINFLIEGGLPDFWPIEIDHENKAITKCRGYTCAIVRDFSSALLKRIT